MKCFFLLFSILFCRIAGIAQSLDTIAFVNQGNFLTGFLFKPAKAERNKIPVVVVLHHSSSGLHSDPPYMTLAEDLNAIGFGVFIYDRRGEGLSKVIDKPADYNDLAKDAVAAIKKLKDLPIIDTNCIGLYGISQGCWIASLVNDLEINIKFNILVSPCTISPSLQMDYAATANLKEHGFSSMTIDSAIALRNIIDDFYRGKLSYAFTADKRKAAEELPWFKHSYMFDINETPEKSLWAKELDYDPLVYFRKLNTPVLLCYGEYDKWVPIQKSIEDWRGIPIQDITIKRISNVGHFMILNEKDNPEKAVISIQYREILKSWIQDKVK